MNWPIGCGRDFKGVYDRQEKAILAFQDFPNDIVITIDDDLFYKSDLIESHLRWHAKYPNAIITFISLCSTRLS